MSSKRPVRHAQYKCNNTNYKAQVLLFTYCTSNDLDLLDFTQQTCMHAPICILHEIRFININPNMLWLKYTINIAYVISKITHNNNSNKMAI